MPVTVIDTIKPKNNGLFPVVDAVDVAVTDELRLPAALALKADAADLAATDAAVALKADKTTTDDLQGQINEIAQSAGTGTADTEIAQARVDAEGAVYTTLKDRLDTADELTAKATASPLASCDLDDVDTNGIWLIASNNTYEHLPDDVSHTAGYLFCFALGGWTVQLFIPFSRKGIYRRAGNALNPFTDWMKITDDGLEDTINGIIKTSAHNSELNRFDVIASKALRTDRTDAGITYEWTGDVCAVSGTASGTSFCNLFNSTISGSDFKAGQTYYMLINDSTAADVFVRIYFSDDGTTLSSPVDIKKSQYFTIPAGTVSMIIRFQVSSGTQISGTASCFCSCLNYAPIKNYGENHTVQLDSCDLNDLSGNHAWLLTDNRTYDHLPTDKAHKTGYLFTHTLANWRLQLFIPFTWTGIYRRASNGTSWQNWTQIADGGGGGGDVYNITNEYTVNCSPSITADTNDYLAPSGDNSDRKLDIISMLTETGVCRLGAGDYYVSGVDMPDNTMLIGSGTKTRLILLGTGTTTGYAVKLGNRCSVKDMSILGSTSDIMYSAVSSTIIDRNGILFEANYDTDQSYKERCNIENVWIKNFTGGGITCRNTGYGTSSCMNVSNTYIYQCNAGIYIPYWSEFHRFTNVHAHNCYYGAVANGGNCSFVNCGFSGNRVGMLMDNSSNQSPNNSHGQVVGCVFDHADANGGVGIMIDGQRNGQIFSDCQLFFADLVIRNSSGIQLNNFNVGGGNVDITVEKGLLGGLVLFNNFVFQDNSYSITVDSGYTSCKFNNCWTRSGTAVTG